MYLKKLKIVNFRNIENISLELNSKINIFIGNNAQGKTSILESIYVLALTKSSKYINDNDLIKFGTDFSYICGDLKVGTFTKKMEISFKKDNKNLKIGLNKIKKISDYLSNMNIIMFSPDDLDIVKKSPQIRRNLLNIELCQLFINYLRILNEYNKILKLRNEYLKNDYSKINFDYLNILTDKLIDRAIIIQEYREKYIENINSNIDEVYYKIMHEHGLKVNYEKSVNFSSKEDYKKFFKDNIYNDINKKMTIYGPHRDDFSFYLNNIDLKTYGSQGQQRISVLAFKLSEIKLFKEKTGNSPIVLLDDIFSEIDINKRNNLLKFIKSNIQFIITTTDLKNISDKILDKASVFKVKNGKIIR